MSDRITIRPAPDRTVRNPSDMAFIPKSGLSIEAGDPYWYRRWLEGDVEVIADNGKVVRHPHAPAIDALSEPVIPTPDAPSTSGSRRDRAPSATE